MVIGNDIDFAAFIAQIFYFLYPILEFFFCVEIIVSFVPTCILFKPVLVISSVQPDVGEFGIGVNRAGPY